MASPSSYSKRAKLDEQADGGQGEIVGEPGRGQAGGVDTAAPAAPATEGVAAAAENAPQEPDGKWWCYRCAAVARAACSDRHPASLMAPAAAEAKLSTFRRWAERAQRKLHDAWLKRGARLEVSFEGWWDGNEFGIMDGGMTIALRNESPLPESIRKEICDGMMEVKFSWDPEEESLTGDCDFSVAVDEYFPLRPQGVELKPGAVLNDGGCVSIYTFRCKADDGVGTRLLGYVTDLSSLEVNGCDCDEGSRGHCYVCTSLADQISIEVQKTTIRVGDEQE